MTTPEEILNIAKQYHPISRHSSLLEPFKDGVLLLRAKEASYENIATILSGKGINVSAATIRKFSLRHGAEIKRLCHEKQRSSDDSVIVAKLNDSSTTRSSSTAMMSKPGPKIARDDF